MTLHDLKPHNGSTRQTIVRLLSSMGGAKEISQYLKRFSQLDAARFAVVKVGGAVLRDDFDALTSSLAFLQDVGLTPIVIHGAGPQLDAELAAAGIEKRTVDGLRVTSPEALAIVRRVFHAQNLRLVEALQATFSDGFGGVAPRFIALEVWALAHGLATLSAAGQLPTGPGIPDKYELLRAGVLALVHGAAPRD